MNLDTVSAAMTPLGLLVRGGFYPTADDQVPVLSNREPAATLVIVGNAGPAMWERFASSAKRRLDIDPLNTWTREVISEAATNLYADALFPFSGPSYYPFQRWAQRAECVWSSPIGILIHPKFGLWHGYRAALVFKERLVLPARPAKHSPCETCTDRPCLDTCPVAAFTGERYDVPKCVAHISTPEGSDCLSLGCRARRACPVGTAFRYDPPQADFHQQAFLRSHMERESR